MKIQCYDEYHNQFQSEENLVSREVKMKPFWPKIGKRKVKNIWLKVRVDFEREKTNQTVFNLKGIVQPTSNIHNKIFLLP